MGSRRWIGTDCGVSSDEKVRGPTLTAKNAVRMGHPPDHFLFISGYNFETVLLPWLPTQTLAPSKARPKGNLPTAYVPTTAPVDTATLLTVLPLKFATQRYVPSNTAVRGLAPTV